MLVFCFGRTMSNGVLQTIFTGALNVPHSPVMPRTPFIPSSGASVPATPFTPFTGFPGKQGGTSQSYFFLQENSRLPLLDDSDNQLATLYNNILQFVERNCVEVMEIAARVTRKHGKKLAPNLGNESPAQDAPQANGTHPGFDIMANVVWAEIARALMDELGALIFAAGKPAEFKSVRLHSILGRSLLTSILELCHNKSIHFRLGISGNGFTGCQIHAGPSYLYHV